MKKHKLFSLIIIIIFSLIRMSCGEDKKDEIKMLVICDGPFEGTFIYNSDTPVGFGGSSTENPYHQTGNSYYFQKTFDDLDSIEVDATRDECTDSLKIKIYRDDEKIKEESLSADSDDDCSDNSLSLTYTYDEEEDDDDSTSSSSS
ncbi:MAG: hypothetical protein V1874_00340 [Spirochaetota bacterium]